MQESVSGMRAPETTAEERLPGPLPRRLARRSRIDPFIVTDVMGEANARQTAGEGARPSLAAALLRPTARGDA